MIGWHHWLNGNESEQTAGHSEGQGKLACYIESMESQRVEHDKVNEQDYNDESEASRNRAPGPFLYSLTAFHLSSLLPRALGKSLFYLPPGKWAEMAIFISFYSSQSL